MGKPAGNKKLALVLVAQFYHDITAECGTFAAEVYSHINNTTLDNPH